MLGNSSRMNESLLHLILIIKFFSGTEWQFYIYISIKTWVQRSWQPQWGLTIRKDRGSVLMPNPAFPSRHCCPWLLGDINWELSLYQDLLYSPLRTSNVPIHMHIIKTCMLTWFLYYFADGHIYSHRKYITCGRKPEKRSFLQDSSLGNICHCTFSTILYIHMPSS